VVRTFCPKPDTSLPNYTAPHPKVVIVIHLFENIRPHAAKRIFGPQRGVELRQSNDNKGIHNLHTLMDVITAISTHTIIRMTGKEHVFRKKKHCAPDRSLEGKRFFWRPWNRQEDESEAFLQKNSYSVDQYLYIVGKVFLQTHYVGVFVFD
jgi:hypothetical protein